MEPGTFLTKQIKSPTFILPRNGFMDGGRVPAFSSEQKRDCACNDLNLCRRPSGLLTKMGNIRRVLYSVSSTILIGVLGMYFFLTVARRHRFIPSC